MPVLHVSRPSVLVVSSLCASLGACVSPEDSPLWTPAWEEHLSRVDAQIPELARAPTVVTTQRRELARYEIANEGPIELSLEGAAVLALRQNRDLAVQQLNPVIAGTFERLERGAFDPEFFAQFEYGEQTASEVNRGTGQQFSVESEDSAGLVGLRQPLPSGTDIEVTVGQDRNISNRAPEQQDARVGLTVTQQLLRGAGPAVNLARIEQARLGTRASRDELRGYAESLLAQVESSYWRYTLAQRQIEIVQESLAIAIRQRDEVLSRIELGVLAPTESAVARAQVALREQGLIDARSELEAQRLTLLRLINAPQAAGAADRVLILTTLPMPEQSPATEARDADTDAPLALVDLDERLALAKLARADLREARLRLQQNRLETLVTRNGLLPRLEVFIALGKTGFDNRFDDSFRRLDEDTYDLAAGLRFSQLLGNDTAEALHQRAYATRQQAALAVANLEQLIELDVRLAWNQVERARQQITASTTTRRLQEDAVRAERERFSVGDSTAILVAQQQRDLLEAQINEVQSRIVYRLALIDLHLAEGTLLDRRGLVIPDEADAEKR